MTCVWDEAFTHPAARRGRCDLEDASGNLRPLPVHRWVHGDRDDDLLIGTIAGWCTGPAVDLGCGPGRVVEALLQRGVPTLGVDGATTAVAMTRARGAAAITRDVFGDLPGEGRWSHALLLDGNIGIGGDPHRLVRRAARLLAAGGSLIVEVDTGSAGWERRATRIRTGSVVTEWFPWSTVGPDALPGLAERAGRRVHRTVTVGARMCAELAP